MTWRPGYGEESTWLEGANTTCVFAEPATTPDVQEPVVELSLI